MFSYSFFNNILKHKKNFNDLEIAAMTPTQSTNYRILGNIKRDYNNSTQNEIKFLNKLINHLEKKKKYILGV